MVFLLGSGLIALLLLNASLNQGAFQLGKLKKQTTELTDEEQALQRDVDEFSAPDALERRARELGMVPGGSPVFLYPDGRVRGMPSVAEADPGAGPAAGSGVPAAGAPERAAHPVAPIDEQPASATPPGPSAPEPSTIPSAPAVAEASPARPALLTGG